jgi:hypothetical protein
MNMKIHNAEEYTVSVRLETIEGEQYYVGRVEELVDVEEYADSWNEARELVLDTIRTTQSVFADEGRAFPAPKTFEATEVSGRVTLRLRKSTHAKAIMCAQSENVSLNSYLSSLIEGQVSLYGIKEVDYKLTLIQTNMQRLTNLVDKISNNNDWHINMFTSLFNRHSFSVRKILDFSIEEEKDDFYAPTFHSGSSLKLIQRLNHVNC